MEKKKEMKSIPYDEWPEGLKEGLKKLDQMHLPQAGGLLPIVPDHFHPNSQPQYCPHCGHKLS